MRGFRHLSALVLPVALAFAVAAIWRGRQPRVCASLYDLIGEAAGLIPAFVREASATELAVLVSSSDAGKARAVAHDLSRKHPLAEEPTAAALEFLRENRGGLVAPETASLLTTAAGRARVARRAKKRLYSSPLPPLLGYADDPFGLTEGFLATLLPKRAAKTAEGCPVLVTNGVTHILLRLRLSAGETADLDRTAGALDGLKRDTAASVSAAGPGAPVSVALAGAPVHAATAAARCKREIGALTWLSLAVIAALALFAFRSLRWLPLLAGSLLVSALAGIGALVLLFRSIHVMTFVLGTTVLGLVIDYSFHWLLSPSAEKAKVFRGLLLSFLTTEISLVPLMLSSIPVLRQSAVFLGTGLAAALVYVSLSYPRDRAGEAVPPRRTAAGSASVCLRRALLALCVLALPGLFRLTVKTEVTALYRPPAELAAAEALRARFGTFDFSVFPSRETREKTAAYVEALYAEHGAEMAGTLGLESVHAPPPPRELVLRPQTFLERMFARWTAEALWRLAFSVGILAVALFGCCRRRAVALLLPPLGSILVVAGIFGWAGVPLNLFHLLAAFLLLGMGIDYAVFLTDGNAAAFKPALCSLLTSLVGFGALAFASFPVVQSFGLVLGLGLPLAFLLSNGMGRSAHLKFRELSCA